MAEKLNGPANVKEENAPLPPRPSRFSGGPPPRFGGRGRGGGPPGGPPRGPRGNVDREEQGHPELQNLQEEQGPQGGPRGGRGRGGGRGGRGGGGPPGGRGRDAGPPGDQGISREDLSRMRSDDRVNDKLSAMSGSTYELPPKPEEEKKFSSRCRLYVGNLIDINENEIKEMFQPYGEISELYISTEKMFAFIRLDYRANAERAKRELDGTIRKGRQLRLRFAPVGAAIKVKNLTPWVTNELLEYGFSIFGDIESAQILVDERGNSLREGIVEFARKPSALLALRRCTEGCYFLTSSLRPVVVEPYDVIDDVDGFPEKCITRKPPEYMKAREMGPRFAAPGSFEYEYGTRWKQLYEMYKQKEEALKREHKLEEEKLEAQMEYAKFEHETEMLREQLRQRELDRERQKLEWEMKERQAEEQRMREEELLRRHTEEMSMRMHHQEEEMRRRQVEYMQRSGPGERGPPPGAFGDANGGPSDAVALREYEALAAAGNLPAEPKLKKRGCRGGRKNRRKHLRISENTSDTPNLTGSISSVMLTSPIPVHITGICTANDTYRSMEARSTTTDTTARISEETTNATFAIMSTDYHDIIPEAEVPLSPEPQPQLPEYLILEPKPKKRGCRGGRRNHRKRFRISENTSDTPNLTGSISSVTSTIPSHITSICTANDTYRSIEAISTTADATARISEETTDATFAITSTDCHDIIPKAEVPLPPEPQRQLQQNLFLLYLLLCCHRLNHQ